MDGLTTMQQKAKSTLEAAEKNIKLFISRGYYGDEGKEVVEREAGSRPLIFAVNYGYTAMDDRGNRLSTIVLELEGSPTKGTIVAMTSGFGFSAEDGEYVDFSVTFLGKPAVPFTEKDMRDVEDAVDAFVKAAKIPLYNCKPVASQNASGTITALVS